MKINGTGLAVGASLALAASAVYAGDKEPDFLCTPGYYKNHTEVWSDLVDQATFDALMADMTATGAHNGALKQSAAAFINA
ncbi:MAG: hypothetical protein ACRES4_10205, partial [Nevskiales bacterium]